MVVAAVVEPVETKQVAGCHEDALEGIVLLGRGSSHRG